VSQITSTRLNTVYSFIHETMASHLHRLNSSASDASFKLSCDAVLSKLVPSEQSLIDSILAHNNPEQPEIILPDGQTFFWYFAIGSMINPISLYLRDLIPIMSYPATCRDYKIVFRGAAGMADIESCPGTEFEGVVHLLSNEQMTRLDELEMFYHRINVMSINYQGQSQIASAYQMKTNDQPVSLPTERYLDIITKGCEYYKVRPEYINRLKDEQPVIPRKHPDTFHSFTNIPSDVYYSLEDLEKHNGNDPLLPIWVCINGKIIEYVGLPPDDHHDYENQKRFHTLVRKRFGGREVTASMAKALYEPLYKLPLSDEDICDEHRARIEDHYYNMICNSQNEIYWKPIGRLLPPDISKNSL
jgi:hypothetical protein